MAGCVLLLAPSLCVQQPVLPVSLAPEPELPTTTFAQSTLRRPRVAWSSSALLSAQKRKDSAIHSTSWARRFDAACSFLETDPRDLARETAIMTRLTQLSDEPALTTCYHRSPQPF